MEILTESCYPAGDDLKQRVSLFPARCNPKQSPEPDRKIWTLVPCSFTVPDDVYPKPSKATAHLTRRSDLRGPDGSLKLKEYVERMGHGDVRLFSAPVLSHADDRATQSQVSECNVQCRASHRAPELEVGESRWQVGP